MKTWPVVGQLLLCLFATYICNKFDVSNYKLEEEYFAQTTKVRCEAALQCFELARVELA